MPISTLGPKLMFGLVPHNFVAACHPFRKRVSGCIQSTRLCHLNYFFVFSQRTCPIHYFRSKNMFGVLSCNFIATHHQFRKRVSGCKQARVLATRTISSLFRNEHAQSTTLGPKLMFGVVSRNFVAARHPFRKQVSGCIQSTSFCHRNHFFVFRNEHAQTTTLGPKLMFWWFRAISLPHVTRSENGCRGAYKHEFCHRNDFFVFRNEHAQSTTLGPKLMFRVFLRNFVAVGHPFRIRVSGCIQSTRFCHQNHFFVFRNEHAQSTTLGPKLMFGWFRAISLRHITNSENGCRDANKHEFLPPEPFLRFFATNMPNPQL
jgi:hypothetical protein